MTFTSVGVLITLASLVCVSATSQLNDACDDVCLRMSTCTSTTALKCQSDGTCASLFRSNEGEGFERFQFRQIGLANEQPLTCEQALTWSTMNAGRSLDRQRPLIRTRPQDPCQYTCNRMSDCTGKVVTCQSGDTCFNLFSNTGTKGFKGFVYHDGGATDGEVPLTCTAAQKWMDLDESREGSEKRPLLEPTSVVEIIKSFSSAPASDVTVAPVLEDACQYTCNRMADCSGKVVTCHSVDTCSNLFSNTSVKGFKGFVYHDGGVADGEVRLTCSAAQKWMDLNESRDVGEKRPLLEATSVVEIIKSFSSAPASDVTVAPVLEDACQYTCNRMADCSGKVVTCQSGDTCFNLFSNASTKGFKGFVYHDGDVADGELALTCTAAQKWMDLNESRDGSEKRPLIHPTPVVEVNEPTSTAPVSDVTVAPVLEDACQYTCNRMGDCTGKAVTCQSGDICSNLFRSTNMNGFKGFAYRDGGAADGEVPLTCTAAQKWMNLNESREGGEKRALAEPATTTAEPTTTSYTQAPTTTVSTTKSRTTTVSTTTVTTTDTVPTAAITTLDTTTATTVTVTTKPTTTRSSTTVSKIPSTTYTIATNAITTSNPATESATRDATVNSAAASEKRPDVDATDQAAIRDRLANVFEKVLREQSDREDAGWKSKAAVAASAIVAVVVAAAAGTVYAALRSV